MEPSLAHEFEKLARPFLATHSVPHEWRDVKSAWWGNRTDLVCGIGQPDEVYASLMEHQIAVGTSRGSHDDFEDFGRHLTDAEIAREAFTQFVSLLQVHGHLNSAANPSNS
jgi:hypothetical protein